MVTSDVPSLEDDSRDAMTWSSPTTSTRRSWMTGAFAGGAAALIAAGAMLWAGRAYGGVILAQLLADRMTGLIPVSVFGRMLGELEAGAKPVSLLGLTVAQAAVGAIIGGIYAGVARPSPRSRALGAMVLAILVWSIFAFVVAPLGGIGILARDAAGGAGETQLLFILAAALYGVITALVVPWPATSPVGDADPSRRRLVVTMAVAVPALAAAAYTGWYARLLREKSSAVPAAIPDDVAGADALEPAGRFAFPGMPRAVTPTPEFYVVSKNFVDPTVDGSSWTLEIGGMVQRPLTLSLSDLLTRPSVEFTATLECISNPVGGKYISTAVWRGIPLVTLLDEAGLGEGVVDLELHAADDYVESIPLAEGIASDTVLVHTMNGEPLTDAHGYPARLIVPGIFGMKNVKWLTKVIAVDQDIKGFWQERGWSDTAPVLTMSRIDTPRGQGSLAIGESVPIGGVAFAGDRGISAVDVSFDGGETWQAAELDEPLSDLSWRLWRVDYSPAGSGSVAIAVRATDGAGEVQTAVVQEPLPDGATGHHTIIVRVD